MASMRRLQEGINVLEDLNLGSSSEVVKGQLNGLKEKGVTSLVNFFLKIYQENSSKPIMKKSNKTRMGDENSDLDSIRVEEMKDDIISLLSSIASFICDNCSPQIKSNFMESVSKTRIASIESDISPLMQSCNAYERRGFYCRSTHPFIAYYKTLLTNLKVEKRNAKAIFRKREANQIALEIYEHPLLQLYETSVSSLSKIKRTIFEKRDFGDLFIIFDVIDNLYSFPETVQYERLRDILAEHSSLAIQSCNLLLDEIKENSSSPFNPTSVPANSSVHEVTINVSSPLYFIDCQSAEKVLRV